MNRVNHKSNILNRLKINLFTTIRLLADRGKRRTEAKRSPAQPISMNLFVLIPILKLFKMSIRNK